MLSWLVENQLFHLLLFARWFFRWWAASFRLLLQICRIQHSVKSAVSATTVRPAKSAIPATIVRLAKSVISAGVVRLAKNAISATIVRLAKNAISATTVKTAKSVIPLLLKRIGIIQVVKVQIVSLDITN